jgi:methylated-DNA-[protein]-cysteine S-methyltransferase
MKPRAEAPPEFCVRKTPFGPITILWSVCKGEPKICRIVLTGPGMPFKEPPITSFTVSPIASRPEINEVADQIDAFLQGEDVCFSLDVLRFDLCTPFQKRVLFADHAIPRGRVSTYQLIAKHLRLQSGARAVGTVLAANPFPIVIPCHRVVRSDGLLGGYQGGLKMKRALLEMEGIPFRDTGQVATGDFFYRDGGSV